MASTTNARRNLVFGAILAILTIAVAIGRFDLFFDDDNEVRVEEMAPIKPPAPPDAPEPPPPPTATDDDAPPPPLLGLSFQDYAERYTAVRDSFRARDELTAQVDEKRINWTGIVRNVSRQTNGFYVSVRPQDGYGPVSALIVYPPEFEETVYALRPDDRVRFEGVVTRASGSLSIQGTHLEKTASAPAD